MATQRNSRTSDNRENSMRLEQWAPASSMPEPAPEEGYKFRWVRRAMVGVEDLTNVSKTLREGWEFCKLSDHPEMKAYVDKTAKASGLIESGGLVLAKIPEELAASRAEYYSRLTNAQSESVDNNLMKESHASMPISVKRESSVSFGNG